MRWGQFNMADWTKRLRTASFRGVRFGYEDATIGGGRRNANHQYPFRDQPYAEDMGRQQRSFSITAHIVGDDYISRSKALVDACEKGGPGQLVHPTRGTFQVNLESFSLRETSARRRIAIIDMSFVESGKQKFPAGLPNNKILVGLSADSLITAAKETFTGGISVLGVPEFVRTAFADTLGGVGDLMSTLQGNGAFNFIGDAQSLINEAANMADFIDELTPPSLSLITDVFGVSDLLESALGLIGKLSPSQKSAVSSYQKMQGMAVPQRPVYTPLVALENANRTVTKTYVDTVSLANEAKATPYIVFPAYEDAIAARKSIIERIDIATLTASDNEYAAYRDLRAKLIAALPDEAVDLPRLQTITLAKFQPALVVAYDLYEDASRDEEIITRNKVNHAGFVPGGTPLEVLSDV